MADAKPRAPRARKKTTAPDGDVKPAAKQAAETTRPRKRKTPVAQPADIATLAYLLWEQGAPGDATEHWLRAEQELVAA